MTQKQAHNQSNLKSAIEKLIEAIDGVQDWSGTYVGDCIKEVESILDCFIIQPAEDEFQQEAHCRLEPPAPIVENLNIQEIQAELTRKASEVNASVKLLQKSKIVNNKTDD
jgi:hypothetical protein